ncbi:MAG: excinuclease ABC subunit UvrC [Candidatus Omnitrophota bacterium]|jgi:excinuclease ABC subunit C
MSGEPRLQLKDKISRLPESPGVYKFKDAAGTIIYIGKAKALKKRVQSYFSRYLDAKTQALVARIADVEYLSVSTESQAQILEASLIKENRPQYNIDLKDDKSFPWVRITNERIPLVSICRNKKAGRGKNDTAAYFGPYTNAALLRQAFKVMRRIFGFRSCGILPKQPCLYYRLGLCPAPCAGKISAARYREIIREIEMFLDFRQEELIAKLTEAMDQSAQKQRFEEAGRFRDQINSLSAVWSEPSARKSADELEDLRKLLGLPGLPERIEAFDISNISGTSATGSMVSFFRGIPDKNNYRRFRIKTVAGINDYDMMREVVRRRYRRLIDEKRLFPDLVLIDGGRQHLEAVKDELRKLGVTFPLAGIAKDRENIYTADRKYPVHLPFDTPALNLIRRIRDEAHRFAITYHRLLRKKKQLE